MSLPVLVIGAGVAGCASAAVLADAGFEVVLVNSSLDVVGLPAYGPDLSLPGNSLGELEVLFASLPPAISQAWLLDALVTAGAPGLVLVDRRAVSLRTKWILEQQPNVRVRQALVTGIRVDRSGAEESGGPVIEADTGLGETLAGRACVLAVGLALGGRTLVGAQVLPGGRYGEVAADLLRDSLLSLQVPLVTVERAVGRRLQLPTSLNVTSRSRTSLSAGLGGWVAGMQVLSLQPYGISGEGKPSLLTGHTEVPSPYEENSPLERQGLLMTDRDPCVQGLFPDGWAAQQWYATPGFPERPLEQLGLREMQAEHRIEAEVLSELGQEGVVESLPGVWAAGQVAGARTYLESLSSGARAGRAVARWLQMAGVH